MGMRIAAKTGLFMGIGSFDATATGTAYTTPAAFAPRIGSLSYMAWKEAEARIQVDTDAVGVVKIMAGTAELGSLEFSGPKADRVPLDLMDVQGQTPLTFVVELTTVGTGEGTVAGSIDIEQPGAILAGC